jgi:hypothetical protein
VSMSPGVLRAFFITSFLYLLVTEMGAMTILFPMGVAQRMNFRYLYAAGILARTDARKLYDVARQ